MGRKQAVRKAWRAPRRAQRDSPVSHTETSRHTNRRHYRPSTAFRGGAKRKPGLPDGTACSPRVGNHGSYGRASFLICDLSDGPTPAEQPSVARGCR